MAEQDVSLNVIRFWSTPTPRGEAVDWVEIASVSAYSPQGHVMQSCNHRVRSLMPRADGQDGGYWADVIARRWAVIKPQYEAWKSGQELPEHGTPLIAWSTLTSDQAAALREAGLRTVEEVAGMHDNRLGSVRLPDARAIRTAAGAWLEGQKTDAAAQRIEALEAQIAALMADKPKRGRPAKAAEPEPEAVPEAVPEADDEPELLFGER